MEDSFHPRILEEVEQRLNLQSLKRFTARGSFHPNSIQIIPEGVDSKFHFHPRIVLERNGGQGSFYPPQPPILEEQKEVETQRRHDRGYPWSRRNARAISSLLRIPESSIEGETTGKAT